MANIRPRKNKQGEIISYEIRVFKGRDESGKQLKPYTTSWKPAPGMTAKQIEKELNRQAIQFEDQCKLGYQLDNRQTFAQYAEYVIALKERSGVKHSVIFRYRDLLKRINAGIGHIKIAELRPQHLNNLYEQLSQKGIRGNNKKAVCKVDLKQVIHDKGITKESVSKLSDVSLQTLSACYNNKTISFNSAEKIAAVLNMPVTSLFNIDTDDTPLSAKTITEYHRLISTILAQADKEMIIPYNPAQKATPPKSEKSQPNYFQPEQVEAIRNCLEQESIKWRTIVHLMIITGARRGEIAGLKWSAVDWKNNQIHICNNLLIKSDIGVYEDTPKTKTSDRFIKLPAETMEMLKEYRTYWYSLRNTSGTAWNSFIEITNSSGIKNTIKSEYLFVQESGNKCGYPINPDSITDWCGKFSKKYNLPHINPHAFRHTMASLLYFNGVDSISIAGRLGHSKPSTTTDMYSHIIKEADERSAECIANAILRKKA